MEQECNGHGYRFKLVYGLWMLRGVDTNLLCYLIQIFGILVLSEYCNGLPTFVIKGDEDVSNDPINEEVMTMVVMYYSIALENFKGIEDYLVSSDIMRAFSVK